MKHAPPLIEIPIRSTVIQVACPFCCNPEEDGFPLTREVLDEFSCTIPDCTCTVAAVTPQCHPESDLRPYYCKKHGTLSLFCGKCGELTAVFAIASEEDSQLCDGH